MGLERAWRDRKLPKEWEGDDECTHDSQQNTFSTAGFAFLFSLDLKLVVLLLGWLLCRKKTKTQRRKRTRKEGRQINGAICKWGPPLPYTHTSNTEYTLRTLERRNGTSESQMETHPHILMSEITSQFLQSAKILAPHFVDIRVLKHPPTKIAQ